MDIIAYKLLLGPEMEALERDGKFDGAPIDLADGYIHMSSADQLAETASKHYAGRTGLVLLTVDLDGLGADLVWEASRGGAMFPHLYADLPVRAVIQASPFDAPKAVSEA